MRAMNIGLIVLGVLLLIGVIVVILVIIAAARRSSSQNSQAARILNHPNMDPIRDIVFANGQRPEKLILTSFNGVWYGPVNGTYAQIPPQYLQPMDPQLRRGIASVLAQTMGYTWSQGPAQTGVPAIDGTAEIVLVTDRPSAGYWR